MCKYVCSVAKEGVSFAGTCGMGSSYSGCVCGTGVFRASEFVTRSG